MDEETSQTDEEELDTDELAEDASDKVDALIELLIEKGIITEEEFDKKCESMFEEDEGEETGS